MIKEDENNDSIDGVAGLLNHCPARGERERERERESGIIAGKTDWKIHRVNVVPFNDSRSTHC